MDPTVVLPSRAWVVPSIRRPDSVALKKCRRRFAVSPTRSRNCARWSRIAEMIVRVQRVHPIQVDVTAIRITDRAMVIGIATKASTMVRGRTEIATMDLVMKDGGIWAGAMVSIKEAEP